MFQLTQFYAYQSYLFKPTLDTLRIYSYSQEDIDNLKQIKIQSLEDCESLYEQITHLVKQYREEQCVLVHNKEIEDISTYSHTPSNRLTGEKKQRFEYLQSMKQLLQALHSHYTLLPTLNTSILSSHISTIQSITSKHIHELEDKINELESSHKSLTSQLQLKERSKQELYDELEAYKKDFLQNKKLHEKKYKEQLTIDNKTDSITNKIELHNRSISRIQTQLKHLSSSQASSYLPTYQLILSLGLLFYSSKNTKHYQIQVLEEKIFTIENTIEKLQTSLLQLKQQHKKIEQEAQKYAKLCSEEEIERRNQELEDIAHQITRLKKKSSGVLEEKDENQLKRDNIKLIQQKCSQESIQAQFDIINSQIELIERQLDIYSQDPVNNLHDGYYYQNS
ncbi:MAG: hypothetical protein ACLFPL_03700 [Candidatus Nanoarchaeia archaeon]